MKEDVMLSSPWIIHPRYNLGFCTHLLYCRKVLMVLTRYVSRWMTYKYPYDFNSSGGSDGCGYSVVKLYNL